MTPIELSALILLGGLLGLDTVSFPQAMLSRPIVAGTASGLVLGAPGHGLLLGAVLELFAVDTLPFGASRYPEWGSSSVVGGGLFATLPTFQSGGLVTSALSALLIAWLGGWSMVQMRRLNAYRARGRHAAVARGDRDAIMDLQLRGLTIDLMRGMVLTALGLLVMLPLQRLALDGWGVGAGTSQAVVVSAAAAVSLGAAYKLFHVVPGFFWQFLLGFVAGLILVVLQ